jgi:hypothetical protein
LEVKNSSGEVVEAWSDSEGTQVVDPQVAYLVSDILADPSARFSIYAPGGYQSYGYVVPGVWTATKTGTTTTTNSAVTKDSLIEGFSTALSTFVWNGNHDGAGLSSNANDVPRNTVGTFMERVHHEVLEPDGKWHPGDQPTRPEGIQTLNVNGKTDLWPSWFNAAKNSGIAKETLTFNKYNHLLAASCTAEDQKIQIEVTKVTDPMTGQGVYSVPEPYNRDVSDTCDFTPPQLALSVSGSNIIATIRKGTNDVTGYTLVVDGNTINGISLSGDGKINGYTLKGNEKSIQFTISDSSGYTVTSDMTLTPSNNSSNKQP